MQLCSTVIPPRSHSTRLNSRRVLFIIRRIYLVGSSLIHTRSFNTVQRLVNVFACPSATKLSPFEYLYRSESRRDSNSRGKFHIDHFTESGLLANEWIACLYSSAQTFSIVLASPILIIRGRVISNRVRPVIFNYPSE